MSSLDQAILEQIRRYSENLSQENVDNENPPQVITENSEDSLINAFLTVFKYMFTKQMSERNDIMQKLDVMHHDLRPRTFGSTG